MAAKLSEPFACPAAQYHIRYQEGGVGVPWCKTGVIARDSLAFPIRPASGQNKQGHLATSAKENITPYWNRRSVGTILAAAFALWSKSEATIMPRTPTVSFSDMSPI